MSTRIFVSDVHLNAGIGSAAADSSDRASRSYDWLTSQRQDAFTAFLEHLAKRGPKIDDLVILGDFLDDWVYPVDVQPPTLGQVLWAERNAPVRRALESLAGADTRIIYMPGNHDMSINQADLLDLPITFGGSSLHDCVYRVGRLHAEHGSAHTLFSAPDPENSPGSRLPLGYFISRVEATRVQRQGTRRRRIETYVDDLLELLGPQKLASTVWEAILEETGLRHDVEIVLPNGFPITAQQVKERYANVYDQWASRHGGGRAFKSLLAEIGWIGDVADRICKSRGTNVVVFGHSHDAELDKDSWFVEDRIYANCGTWCDPKKPCTFVEVERRAREQVVRLFEWKDGRASRLKEESTSL